MAAVSEKGIHFNPNTKTFRLYCGDSLYAFCIGPELLLENLYWDKAIRNDYDLRYLNSNLRMPQFGTAEYTSFIPDGGQNTQPVTSLSTTVEKDVVLPVVPQLAAEQEPLECSNMVCKSKLIAQVSNVPESTICCVSAIPKSHISTLEIPKYSMEPLDLIQLRKAPLKLFPRNTQASYSHCLLGGTKAYQDVQHLRLLNISELVR